MQARELAIPGVIEFTPKVFPDSRGMFTAPFQEDVFLATLGHPLHLAQTNHSVSQRGTLRGIHYADVPPGQAKYVYCGHGALLDVAIDLRVGSPTFGRWDSVVLDAVDFRGLYLPEGVGHAMFALTDDTVLTYHCSVGYNPSGEHGINPLDPALNLPWPTDIEPVLSAKDVEAPTLAEAEAAGMLPSYDKCLAFYESLRTT